MTSPSVAYSPTQNFYDQYRSWSSRTRNPALLPPWEELQERERTSWFVTLVDIGMPYRQGLKRRDRPKPTLQPVEHIPLPRLWRDKDQWRAKSYVYFIGSPSGHIKIGISGAPELRLAALQTGSPVRLEILGVIASREASKLEKKLHDQFASTRSHGEWFLASTDLLAFIGEFATKRASA